MQPITAKVRLWCARCGISLKDAGRDSLTHMREMKAKKIINFSKHVPTTIEGAKL